MFRVHRFVVKLAGSAKGARTLSDCDVLGGKNLPPGTIKTLITDLRVDIGECISASENRLDGLKQGDLNHLESPEADAAHLKRVQAEADALFAKLPLPQDPMKAALDPTEDEVKGREEWEVLREAVRERYQRQLSLGAAEKKRIETAMQSYHNGNECSNPPESKPSVVSNEAESLRRRIDRMKEEVARLERMLGTTPSQ
ncbi:hypothetical protein ERJ75_001247400 [Trypanosoma vivax]|uniref:Uncharacterized protein n=1 Tax=Trypanosoma vivax (strain Y486) TaxID=1055687 RepID=G0UD15_TRYVY|nr:hypothetical protein ERJ75_001247400 [Trypanosoma vivax]CCC53725.1 conserved hypothetical protein [Trypanosoma vivax Y486]